MDWIDRIRQNGLDASFIHKEKPAAQLLDEVSEMLDGQDPKILPLLAIGGMGW